MKWLVVIVMFMMSCAGQKAGFKYLSKYQMEKITQDEFRKVRCNMAYPIRNDKGIVIYKNPNYDCSFCRKPEKYGNVEGFATCSNPSVNVQQSNTHAWILGCPDDCEFENNFDGDDYDLIDAMIQQNADDNWMILDTETIDDVRGELSDSNPEYFYWFMNFMGWQIYKDTEGLVLKSNELLFTKEKI